MFKRMFIAMLILFCFWPKSEASEPQDWSEAASINIGKTIAEVRLDLIRVEDDVVRIDVFLDEVEESLIGTSFNLAYDQKSLKFLRYEPGDFFESGGDPIYLVKNIDEEGRIIFGETLRRDAAFPMGEGLITSFYFQQVADENLKFEFEKGILSSLNEVRQDLDNVTWNNLFFDKVTEEELLYEGEFPYEEGLTSQDLKTEKKTKIILLIAFLLLLVVLSGFVTVIFKKRSK